MDTPNDFLRRLLAIAVSVDGSENLSDEPVLPRPVKRYRQRKVGEFMPLVDAGLLLVDDALVYQKRTGKQYKGFVINDGWIGVDGRTFPSLLAH